MILPGMLGFDVETTGVDVECDRIVTAALADVRPGCPPVMWHSMCDPGVEIPAGATEVHGIGTEQARASGRTPPELLGHVTRKLAAAMDAGTPIIGMNLAYDFTILDRECRRHGVEPLGASGSNVGPVVDVYVIDKYVNQFRPGSRKLGKLSEHYGVTLDGAHDAAHDTLAACRVAYKIMRRAHAPRRWLWSTYSGQLDKHGDKIKGWQIGQIVDRFVELSGMDVWDLHWAQARWRAEQAASLEEYLRRTDDGVRVDPWWPVRPYDTVGVPEPGGQLALEVAG